VMRYHSVACQIETSGTLKSLIAWADVVVGPINSGSFVETLALGKPYYPCQFGPSSLDASLFGGAQLCRNAKELDAAITSGSAADRATVLQAMCSIREITNASQRFWSVMERGSKLAGSRSHSSDATTIRCCAP
jgi:hypothetical protein